MTSSDLQQLNTFQHIVCKNALELPKLCLSDISKSLFNVQPISAEIDTRKLLFFGRLCRLDYNPLPKKNLSHSVDVLYARFVGQAKGIYLGHHNNPSSLWPCRLLTKLAVKWYFPNLRLLEKIVRRTVKSSHNRDRERRMSYDSDFSFFREIFSRFITSSIWKLPSTPDEINLCKFISKLCSNMHCNYHENLYICVLCNRALRDVFCHCSCTCAVTSDLRNRSWSVIINSFDIPRIAEISGLSDDDVYMTLIGRHTSTPPDKSLHGSFYLTNFRLMRSFAARYFRALRSSAMWAHNFEFWRNIC